MDTDKCDAILAVLKEGSLSAAAGKLGYTPSGISRMMQSAEEEFGFPLFARGKKGILPTKDCELILPYIRDLSVAGNRLKQEASEIQGVMKGSFVIGTSYYTYFGPLMKRVAEFEAEYPGVSFSIKEGTSTELTRMMEEGEADLCVISRRGQKKNWIPLLEDELIVWLPAGHALADRVKFSLEDLKTEPFIEIYPGKETDNSMMFREKGFKPNTVYRTLDTYAAFSMVEAGLGITLTNRFLARSFSGNVVSRPLDPPYKIEVGIALPARRGLSPAARRFAAFLAENPPAAPSAENGKNDR